MPRGPLPNPQRRRRNAPTIPTTTLNASGPPGPTPRIPQGKKLGKAGRAWWRWAWSTPAACDWSTSELHVAFRRAQLEDDLATITMIDDPVLDIREFVCEALGGDRDQAVEDALDVVEVVLRRLKALAGGKLALYREMRELEAHLGLTTKARAQMRQTIVDDERDGAVGDGPESDEVAKRRTEREKRIAADG